MIATARCAHARFATMRRVEADMDDHTTEYGQCSDCDQYLVHTVFPKHDEWAVMTLAEQQREVDAYDPPDPWDDDRIWPSAENE